MAAEATKEVDRRATTELVVSRLGGLAPHVAWASRDWRPLAGSDVDLVVPRALLDEVTHRLSCREFIPLPVLATAASRTFVRLAEVVVIDRVDLEAGGGPDIRTSAPGDLGRLVPAVAAGRTARRVVERGLVPWPVSSMSTPLAGTPLATDRRPAQLEALTAQA